MAARSSGCSDPTSDEAPALTDKGYASCNVFCRVPVPVRFGEFAPSAARDERLEWIW